MNDVAREKAPEEVTEQLRAGARVVQQLGFTRNQLVELSGLNRNAWWRILHDGLAVYRDEIEPVMRVLDEIQTGKIEPVGRDVTRAMGELIERLSTITELTRDFPVSAGRIGEQQRTIIERVSELADVSSR